MACASCAVIVSAARAAVALKPSAQSRAASVAKTFKCFCIGYLLVWEESLAFAGNGENLELPAPRSSLSPASELVFYLGGSGFPPRRVILWFESRLEPGGVEPVIMLMRPGCVTNCFWSPALTTLLGMDATAPVEPEVPCAWASSVHARRATTATAQTVGVDFIWLSFAC